MDPLFAYNLDDYLSRLSLRLYLLYKTLYTQESIVGIHHLFYILNHFTILHYDASHLSPSCLVVVRIFRVAPAPLVSARPILPLIPLSHKNKYLFVG